MPPILPSDLSKYTATCKTSGALVEPIPRAQDQRGPSCGLYALSIVLEHWYERLASAGHAPAVRPLPARKHAQAVPREAKAPKTATPGSLRALAKKAHLTIIGELWRAPEMVQLADTAGYKGKVVRTDSGKPGRETLTALLRTLLGQQFPCIVGFDVNSSNNYQVRQQAGDPGQHTGNHAHWAVVFGYWARKGVTFWLATHWNSYYGWPAKDLLESNGQLNRWEKGGDWEKERREVKSGFWLFRTTTVEASEFSAPGTLKNPHKTKYLPNCDLDMRDLAVVIYPDDPSVTAPAV